MKKLIVILEILFIVWIGGLIANRYLAYFKIKPIMTFKTIEHSYSDGTAIEYKALGYKVVHYEDSEDEVFKVTPFWTKIETKEAPVDKAIINYVGAYKGSLTVATNNLNSTVDFELIINEDNTASYYINSDVPYNSKGTYSVDASKIKYVVTIPSSDLNTIYTFDVLANNSLSINYNNQNVVLNKVDKTNLLYLK